jgi:hypothetical protein
VHDVTDIEQRGIPAGFVATTEFIDAADTQARVDPARVFVAHPIQDRTEAEIRELADRAFADVAKMICTVPAPER